jgi:hypothetical protein
MIPCSARSCVHGTGLCVQLLPTKQSKLNRAWAGLWCVARQSYSDMYNVRIQPPTQPPSLSVAHHCRCHAARHGSAVCTSTEQRINQAWHEHCQAETAPKIYMTGLSSSLPEDRGESNAPAAILQQRHTDLRSRRPFNDVTLNTAHITSGWLKHTAAYSTCYRAASKR